MRRNRKPLPNRAIKAVPPKLAKASAEINTAIAEVADAVNAIADAGSPFVDADLVTGTNRISHGLGRPVLGIVVVARDPDPSFAVGFDPAQMSNPIPERQVFLEVIGAPMRARIFLF